MLCYCGPGFYSFVHFAQLFKMSNANEVFRDSGYTQPEVINYFYEWTIRNINLIIKPVKLVSPPFPSENVGKGYIFNLELDRSQKILILRYPEEIQEKYTAVYRIFSSMSRQQHKRRYTNWMKLYWTSDFCNNPKNPMPDEDFIIKCEIMVMTNLINVRGKINTINIPEPCLDEDFGALLESGELSDITIETSDGQQIKAHKTILAARSKIFAAMLKHPTIENELGCISIVDFNHKVLSAMLYFMYTSHMPNMSGGIAKDLLAAADKYQLDRLKGICANSLCRSLTPGTAASTLKLADMHNANELKSYTVEFIKMNAEKVHQTAEWQELVKADMFLILESLVDPKFIKLVQKDKSNDGSGSES